MRNAKLLFSENDAQVLILEHEEEVLVVEDGAEAVPEGRKELPQRGALHKDLCVLAERIQAILEGRVVALGAQGGGPRTGVRCLLQGMIRSDVVTSTLAGQHPGKDVYRLSLSGHQHLEVDNFPLLLGDHAPVAFHDGSQVRVFLLELFNLGRIVNRLQTILRC